MVHLGTRSFWLVNIVGWTVFYLQCAVLLNPGLIHRRQENLQLLIICVAGFAISVGLRSVYRRLRRRGPAIGRLLLATVTGSLVAAFLWLLATHTVKYIFALTTFDAYAAASLGRNALTQEAVAYGMLYAGWSLVYFVIGIWLDYREQARRTEQASALAQQAELKLLRYQLNPHFLFNALNSIRALVEVDGAKARAMITELSECLRYVLVSGDNPFIPLREEMTSVMHYLAIEKTRWGDRLEITRDISPAAERQPVPCLILLPLVDNAVKFGMETGRRPVCVGIRAALTDGRLEIAVHDSGSWYTANRDRDGFVKGTGTGLRNVRERLESIYGGKAVLEIERDTAGTEPGVTARIVIPRREGAGR